MQQDPWQAQNERTQQVIAEARDLIAKVDAALDFRQGLYESHGIDRDALVRYVKHMYGPAGEQRLKDERDRTMAQINASAALALQHARFNVVPPPGRHSRRLRNLV